MVLKPAATLKAESQAEHRLMLAAARRFAKRALGAAVGILALSLLAAVCGGNSGAPLRPASPTSTIASAGTSAVSATALPTANPPPTETPLPTAVPLPTRQAIETFSNLCRPTPPDSYRLTSDIAYVVIPFCLVWFPQSEAVDGYLIEVRYSGRVTSETFRYEIPPGVTEFVFPQEAQPHLTDPARCRERELAQIALFTRRGSGLNFVDGVGPIFNCYCLAAEQGAVAQSTGGLACTAP